MGLATIDPHSVKEHDEFHKRFCETRCALLVANPIIYRLVLSPPTYEIR